MALNGGYKALAYDGEPSHGTPFGASSSAPITPASYELTLNELYYTRAPADVVGDTTPPEAFRVPKNNEQREFVTYRTRRLVLEVWRPLLKGKSLAAIRGD